MIHTWSALKAWARHCSSARSSSSSIDRCGGSRRLRFVYDAENEVPIFYANRIGGFWFEQDFEELFRRAYSDISSVIAADDDDGARDWDYSKLDPNACIAAMEAIGHTPPNREIGVCAVPKIFYEKRCYRFRKWMGELMGREFFYHDVLLRPRHLQNLLLMKHGLVRRTRFVKLKAWLDSSAVKHGVEVELMKQRGCNFVIFLSREELVSKRRSVILRELARAGVHVEDDIKLELWRPEDDTIYSELPTTLSTATRKATNIARRMMDRLPMTHCRTSLKKEGEPVEWYETYPFKPGFNTDRLVVDIDKNQWRRNSRAIPWEERLTSTPGGKSREKLTLVEIDGTAADLMLPRKRVHSWTLRRKRIARRTNIGTSYSKTRSGRKGPFGIRGPPPPKIKLYADWRSPGTACPRLQCIQQLSSEDSL